MFYVGREWVDRVWMALDDGPECCYLILDNYFKFTSHGEITHVTQIIIYSGYVSSV